MLLHQSPQAELQSHLHDWCCLWIVFPHILPCLSLVSQVTQPLDKWSSWSFFKAMWQCFSPFPHCNSYCSQFKEWTQINTLSCWNQANLMGCSVLSFMIKLFSNSGFLGCHYKKKKSNFSSWRVEKQNQVILFDPGLHPERPACKLQA